MRISNVGLCAIIVVVAVFGACFVNTTPLLGAKECTYGPSYWCSNLTNAKSCHAVRHCIQTVWEKRQVPADNDSICQICKDMVGQARDQLRSNETMDELKQVFEGSCNLIPMKLIKKECCKLADDFVPELVETLTSQMNPDQVCSVAGLCNNAQIDALLTSYYSGALDGSLTEEPETKTPATVAKPGQLSCGNCHSLATFMTEKFSTAKRDDVLENILHLCGEMSSFSDACSSIVLSYFNDIYGQLKENLGASGICHLSGVCSAQYHQHPEDAKAQAATVTATELTQSDDIPCDLCQQLVHHLRDLLVANTTEMEFKEVLKGLCKQTLGFKDECLSLAEQYYDVIYQSLVHNLDANGACFLIGVCPKGAKQATGPVDIMPLLPAFPPAEIKVTMRKKLGANEPKFTQEDLQAMQLPIDHLMGAANPAMLVANGELCTLCEYMLHFIQDELATQSTEDEIKRTVNNICNKMPNSVRGGCHNFIDMYGDAVIALLIQGLNPREVCPKLNMCPQIGENHDDMEVFDPAPVDESDKPTCPLCLFAVEQAQEKIKNDKSKKNIKNVLDHLCVHLPSKLQTECVDFINTYSSELIDMLITDFKPQEICVSLKLCPKSNSYLDDLGISLSDDSSSDEDSAFNEIVDSDEMPMEIVFEQHEDAVAPNCWLCEEVIKNAEKRMGKHASKEDIKKALENSCEKLRSNLRPKCHHYIDRYGDKIATMLMKEMEPKVICTELGLCIWDEMEDLEIDEALKYDVIAMPNGKTSLVHSDRLTGRDDESLEPEDPPTCVLCEFVLTKLEADLQNKTTQDEIVHTIETVCNRMPKTVTKSCDKFVEQYAKTIISLIGSVPPKQICQQLQLCMQLIEPVVTDEVIECGVCTGAAQALIPFFKQHVGNKFDDFEIVTVACETLPAKYYQICSEMMSIYGQSLLHLTEKEVDSAEVCAKIGKCFDNEKSGSAFARILA